MAGKNTNFQRGGQKKIVRKQTTTKPTQAGTPEMQSGINMDKAGNSAKEMEDHPMAVERIKHLQRQAKNAGIDVKDKKLRAEQIKRLEYNNKLSEIDADSLFANTLIPKNKAIIRLYKKPIFELNGFLKPDLLKQPTDGGGVTYMENRFPYLECGVVVTQNGMEDMFGEGRTYEGAAVSLSLNCKLHKYIYFIDKTDIKPDTFEGYILLPLHELESIVALADSPRYEEMADELTGLTANKALQAEVELEKIEIELKKAAAKKELQIEKLTADIAPDVKEEVQDTIQSIYPEGTVWTDGSHS